MSDTVDSVACHEVARCLCAKAHGATNKIFSFRKACFDCWECSYMSRVTLRMIIVHGKMQVTRWSWWCWHAVARCVCAKAHGQPRKIKIARGDGFDCWECSLYVESDS